jgi:hypothetical protein
MLVLAILLAGAAPDEPAIAESPMRVYRVDMIEANITLGADDEPRLRQFVWWNCRFDRHEGRVLLIDRGWTQADGVTVTFDGKTWTAEYGDVRVESPVLMESVTNVDPQVEYRMASETIR